MQENAEGSEGIGHRTDSLGREKKRLRMVY